MVKTPPVEAEEVMELAWFIGENVEIPESMNGYFGEYRECLFDGYCGEAIAWGFPIVKHLGEDKWREASQIGDLECAGIGTWFLITKWLTPKDAENIYGKVANVERGPRGGFKSVTYGEKKFLSKKMEPHV